MKRLLFVFFALFGLLAAGPAMAQKTITGKVSGEGGDGIPFVNVVVKGTQKGTQTDIEGNFKLEVANDAVALIFSAVGYTKQTVEIGNQTVINVTLAEETTITDAVVITGYASQLKKEFTGSSAHVDAEAIEDLPVLSVDQALQGQAAGVQVYSSSGTPGGGLSIRVRGSTSISASNEPLYVIDGVPVINTDLTAAGMGNQGQSSLASINPDDIQSIEVLKSADATALYGTRGANGVVLITTKRGKEGKSTFDFSMFKGIAQPTNKITMLNTSQYYEIINEARTNDGLAPITGFDETVDTNWFDQIFRDANVEQYQISAQGGNENTRYYMSGSYRTEEGTILGSSFERFTTRLNLDHKASDRLTLTGNVTLNRDLNNRIKNDNNIFGVLSTAILTSPNIPVYNEDGSYSSTPFGHPLASAVEPRYANTTFKFIGGVGINYKILEGLNFKMNVNGDYTMLREDHYEPSNILQGAPSNGIGTNSLTEDNTVNIEPQIHFNRVFAEKHKVSGFVGSTILTRHTRRTFAVGQDFLFDDINYITSAGNITDGSSSLTRYDYLSFFGSVNYAYDSKYLLTVVYRQDASSRFGADQRWGAFPAVSGGWVISDEAFFENVPVINFLKLRAGYGVTGNDRFGNFQFASAWASLPPAGNPWRESTVNYGGAAALIPDQIENANLKWEETATLDVGLEFSLFENRLNANIGYYSAETTDLLYSNPLSWVTGFSGFTANVGTMRNTGVELELRGTPIDMQDVGFKWDVNFNLSANRNELVELISPEPIPSGFSSVIQEGEPLTSFRALEFIGLDEFGDAVYTDVDGDGEITSNDEKIIGNFVPDFSGGLTNKFSYKGISLSIFFQFVQGVDIYNNNGEFIRTVGLSSFNQQDVVLDRWTPENTGTDVPRAATGATSGTFNNQPSSRFLEDGSYVRLKNLTLTYTLPSSIIEKTKVLRSARIGFSGQNILTFTNYTGFDPEVSTFDRSNVSAGTDFLTFPQSKIYSVNFNLGF